MKRIEQKRYLLLALAAATVVFSLSFTVPPAQEVIKPAGVCDSIPPLNKLVLEFVNQNMNRKVGLGECWDLAAEALDAAGAKWDHEYKFGRLIDLKKECALAGDIVQFDKIKIDYKEKGTYYRENLSHHTAIIYEVIEQDNFVMAEQNTGRLGQKVGTSPLELKNIKAGKFRIYRPVK